MISLDDLRVAAAAELSRAPWMQEVGAALAVATQHAYPDGESVQVLIRPLAGGDVEISDAGEALRWAVGRGYGRSAGRNTLERAVAGTDLTVRDSAIVAASVDLRHLRYYLLAVAAASVRMVDGLVLGDRASASRQDFREEVTDLLFTQWPDLSREYSIAGDSGREYKMAAFHPPTHTVIDTVGSNRMNVMGAVYAEFSDITQVNGYRAVAVIDDTRGTFETPDRVLLGHVARVVAWSNREQWLGSVLAV